MGVPWLHSACGTCEFCLRGEENLCPQARFTGFHVDGGYAEYMLADAALPAADPAADRAMSRPPRCCAPGLSATARCAWRTCIPASGWGWWALAPAPTWRSRWRAAGAAQVYVFTRSAEHRRHAEELGAAWTGGIEDKAPKLLDRAVIFAPSGKLVPLALEKLRPGGTLAINAIHMSDIPAMPYRLIYGERTLRSVANATYRDGVEFLRIANEMGIQVDGDGLPAGGGEPGAAGSEGEQDQWGGGSESCELVNQ